MRFVTNKQRATLAFLLFSQRTPERLEIVKWAFLFRYECSSGNQKVAYDFVPYRYGPFSFEMYHDLQDLEDRGLVRKDLTIAPGYRSEVAKHVSKLPPEVSSNILALVSKHKDLSKSELINFVYREYPWFSLKSKLGSRCCELVHDPNVLFTKGYEGITIDAYFNDLLKNGVRRLVDVRRNPFSHKFGFSKQTLAGIARKLDIEYVHLPELGISSDDRSQLGSSLSYKRLFGRYEKRILRQQDMLERLDALDLEGKRSLLMCFEKYPQMCHRSIVSSSIASKRGLKVVHL